MTTENQQLDLRQVAAFQANLDRAIDQIAGRLSLTREQAEHLTLSWSVLTRHRKIGATQLIRELAVLAGEFVPEASDEQTASRN